MATEQDDFVDRVAQAVIDKIEERDKVASLVEQIAHRVLAIQKQEAALKEAAAQTPTPDGADAVKRSEKAED